MSTFTQSTSTWTRLITRRRVVLAVSLVVLVWSAAEVVSLGLNHTIGAEIYGVLAAAITTFAAAASFGLLWLDRRRALVMAGLLFLWVVVVLSGLAGTYYHIVGVAPDYGPIDPRTPPFGAPLVFVALGFAGAAALVIGQRDSAARQKGK